MFVSGKVSGFLWQAALAGRTSVNDMLKWEEGDQYLFQMVLWLYLQLKAQEVGTALCTGMNGLGLQHL